MAGFSCTTERTPKNVIIVRTKGYFDDEGGDIFRSQVEPLFHKGEKVFLLNFRESPLINSTGISILIELAEEITAVPGGRVVFCGLSKAVDSVFRMMGLTTAFSVFDSEETALAQL
jgi:anti-anti-sigma factor